MTVPETPHPSPSKKPAAASVRHTVLPTPAISLPAKPKPAPAPAVLPTPVMPSSATPRPKPVHAPAVLPKPTISLPATPRPKPAPAPAAAPPKPVAAPTAPRKSTLPPAKLPTPSVDPTLTLKPTIDGAPRPKSPTLHRPVVHVSPRAGAEPAVDATATTVLPPRLNEETGRFFQQALHGNQIDKGYTWILDKMSDENDPTSLAGQFMKRYEEQIAALRGPQLEAEGCRSAFRATLAATMLRDLPRYRLRFANRSYNAIFLETWLKKQLLAAILGLSSADIERKVFLSGRTAPVFVNGELQRLLHTTFLAGILKA